ncbi:hypothetical protein JCM13664_13480 [Methylothermus subterraneus]
MLKHSRYRRILGAALIVSGALLMWLTPEILAGTIAILLAFVLEILGIYLERLDRKRF